MIYFFLVLKLNFHSCYESFFNINLRISSGNTCSGGFGHSIQVYYCVFLDYYKVFCTWDLYFPVWHIHKFSVLFFFFFSNQSLFFSIGRIGKREGRTKKQRDVPTTAHSKCLQHPELCQSKAKSWKLNIGPLRV